jgi:hypothetical protein
MASAKKTLSNCRPGPALCGRLNLMAESLLNTSEGPQAGHRPPTSDRQVGARCGMVRT